MDGFAMAPWHWRRPHLQKHLYRQQPSSKALLYIVPFFADDPVNIRVRPPLRNDARPGEPANFRQPVIRLNRHGHMLARRTSSAVFVIPHLSKPLAHNASTGQRLST